MLAQVLPEFSQRFDIEFKLFFTHSAVFGIDDNKKLWSKWALHDANIIANLYQLPQLTRFPCKQALHSGQQLWQMLPDDLASAKQVFDQTWCGQFSEHYLPSTPVINRQVKNLQRMLAKGQEVSGSIYCQGDWFCGVDSLFHLERMLNNRGYNLGDTDVIFDKTELAETENKSSADLSGETLNIYLSIRSPYSYLGLVQAQKLQQKFGIKLNLKPILPMLMRSMSISSDKQKYIYLDAFREATKLDIDFGALTDPLGEGVFNCYRYFDFARRNGKSVEYMLAMYRAVFFSHIDLADEDNIDKILSQLDLDIRQAKEHAKKHDWQALTDKNQGELAALGYWGVPTFQLNEVTCWGQDRLFLIEQALIAGAQAERCEPKE